MSDCIICGLAFNVVFDPVVGYFYKQYILEHPQKAASVLAKLSAFTTFFNEVISIILVALIYSAIFLL